MSIKRILIMLGVIFGVVVLVGIAFVVYKGTQSKFDVENKINDALARSVRKQVLLITELYYDENKVVPKKLADLIVYSDVISKDSPGINLIEYRYIDPKNSEVCFVFDSPHEQKCLSFIAQQ